MAEVTPRKRQDLQERFNNRLAGYRKHSSECGKKYHQTQVAIYEQDNDQTLFLKQKFLQNTQKRGAKRKLDNPNNTSSVRVETKNSIINNTNEVSSPTHAPATLPTISSPTIPNPITNVKQEHREYIDVADLQSDMPFEFNEVLIQDAISSLMSDKDSIFTQNHQQTQPQQQQQQQQPPPPAPPSQQQQQQQQQQQTLQTQRQQMVSHEPHHSLQHHHHHPQQQPPHANNHQLPSSFHQTPIKIEDVNKNSSLKNHNAVPNQQHISSHMQQQSHQMHSTQQIHQQSHQSPGPPIQISMTQNVSVSVNLNSPPVTAPPRQGLYFVNQNSANCNIKIEPNQNHINLPNAQNINFNQQQMRHHNAAPSTNSSPHHTVDSPVGDQHKLTQQLQHQHLLRQQQLFKQQQQQQQQQQQLQQSHQQQTQHQQHAQHHQQSQQHSQRHQQTPQQPASQQQSQTQQQMQHQIRQQQQQQQIPQQSKQMTSILRPPPPEYNVNGRQSSTQFQGLPCNVPQRLPQQNTNFSSGAILRPPSGGLPTGNRSFSEELMLMSANQRLNYHSPARMTGDMNPEWRQVVNSQQRNPQQTTFRTNFVQTPGMPVHNNNMNMMSGHLQQMSVRTMPNNEQQKQPISLQHTNYPVQINLQMLQCMNSGTNNSGVSSASSQMYTQTGNTVGTHMLPNNSMTSHVTNNVPNLHQNTHRSPEVPPSLQNNTGAMNNCNSSNVNSMQDFNLDCLLEPDNDFYLNLSDFMQ